MAVHYRFLGQMSDIDVTRCVDLHPALTRWRDLLEARGVTRARAQALVEHLLTAALDDFAAQYVGEINGHLDDMVRIRDELGEVYESALSNLPPERISSERSGELFQQLEDHFAAIDDLTASHYLDRRSSAPNVEETLPHVDRVLDELQATRQSVVPDPETPESIVGAGDPFGAPPPAGRAARRDPLYTGDHSDAGEAGLDLLNRQKERPELLQQIVALREAGQPDWVVLGIVRGIGQTLSWSQGNLDRAQLRGISRFLEHGGDPRVLLRLLNWQGSRYGAVAASDALARLALLHRADYPLLGLVLRHREGVDATNVLIGMLRWIPGDDNLREILGLLNDLEPRSRGLGPVLAYLASRGENLNVGAWGALRAARLLLDQYPGSRLRFEEPLEADLAHTRIPDFRIDLPGTDPLGQLFIEVKEILDANVLAGHGTQQFSLDVQHQIDLLEPYAMPRYGAERTPLVLPDWMPHPLARLRWVIRNPNLHPETPVGRLEVEAFQHTVVTILAQAFNDPPLSYHPRRAELLEAFVLHQDEIILFQ